MMGKKTIVGTVLAAGVIAAGFGWQHVKVQGKAETAAVQETAATRGKPQAELSPEEKSLVLESPRQRAERHKEFMQKLESVRQGIEENRRMADAIAEADQKLDKAMAEAQALRTEVTSTVKHAAELDKLPEEAQEKLKQANDLEAEAMEEHSRKIAELKEVIGKRSH